MELFKAVAASPYFALAARRTCYVLPILYAGFFLLPDGCHLAENVRPVVDEAK
jgi:hypothetical protein